MSNIKIEMRFTEYTFIVFKISTYCCFPSRLTDVDCKNGSNENYYNTLQGQTDPTTIEL